MGQRNGGGFAAGVCDTKRISHDIGERARSEESVDGQPAHRNHQRGLDEPQLVVQPWSAGFAFVRRWDTIAPSRRTRSGITARNGGDVDGVARSGFVYPRLLEPAEQSAAGPAGKGPAVTAFYLAGCLTNQHDARCAREGKNGHDGCVTVPAPPAGTKRSAVPGERAVQG